MTLLDAVAVDTTSNALRHSAATHSVQFFWGNTGGSMTALSITLYGSLDGINYTAIDVHAATAGEISAKSGLYQVANKPVEFVKVLADLTDSGTTALTVLYSGK